MLLSSFPSSQDFESVKLFRTPNDPLDLLFPKEKFHLLQDYDPLGRVKIRDFQSKGFDLPAPQFHQPIQ